MLGSFRSNVTVGIAVLVGIAGLSYVLAASAAPPGGTTAAVEFTPDGKMKRPEGYREWIESVTSSPRLSPTGRILALFDGLIDATAADGFRGCPFLMALAEYPDPRSAAHASAHEVKAWVRDKLRELVAQLPGHSKATARVLGDQLVLVVEGLYASIAALGSEGPARQARTLAAMLLQPAR